MFDVGASEFLLVVIVAIVVIGPKDLPLALRTAGRWIGKVRRVSGHFRAGIETMVREAELEEMEKAWREQNAAIMALDSHPVAGTPPDPAISAEPLRTSDTSAKYLRSCRCPPHEPAHPMLKVREIDESEAPLLDHLIELRGRLLRCVLALGLAFAVCLYFADDIFSFLVQPLTAAFPPGQGKLIYTKLYEAFFVNLKVALFAAFFVSFPVIANQLWAFVAPGLYAKEKRAFLPFLIATPVLFGLGAALAYYIVMPTAFRWFLGFEGDRGGLKLEALPGTGDYLSLVMQFILAFGISFLLPVLLLLLNRAGIVSREQLANARRYVIVAIFAVAAVATPPDVVSQLMLAIPLLFLFEGSLLVMRLSERRARIQAENASTERHDPLQPTDS